MEYIYTGLLLHKAGQQINEENVTNVLKAASAKVDEARVKSLCAALDGVNIDEAISKAVPVAAGTAASSVAGESKQPEKKEEEKKVSEEEAASGLSGLFG